MSNIFTKKNLCIAFSVLIGVSTILTFVNASVFGMKVSVSLLNTDYGIFVLLFAVIALVCSILEKYIPTMIAGGLSLGIFILKHLDLAPGAAISGELTSFFNSYLQFGIGYYLLLISSLALTLFAFVGFKVQKHKAQKREEE